MKPNVTNKINALVFIISQLRKKVQRKPYIEPVLIRTGSFFMQSKKQYDKGVVSLFFRKGTFRNAIQVNSIQNQVNRNE